MRSVSRPEIERVRKINHLTQGEIAAELGIPEQRVEWIGRRYLTGQYRRRFKEWTHDDDTWGNHHFEMTRLRESDAAAAHWAGVTFEDYRMHPMRRTSQVMQPTWVPGRSSAA